MTKEKDAVHILEAESQDEKLSEILAEVEKLPGHELRNILMTALEYARQIRGIDNEPGLDIFFSEYTIDRHGSLIVWETGFAMSLNTGKVINPPDIPSYAQPKFWEIISRHAVYDKPFTSLPHQPGPQVSTAGAQMATSHPQGSKTIQSLECFPGEGGGIFVITWEGGLTDSNSDLDKLLEGIGQTVDQLIKQGVKVAI